MSTTTTGTTTTGTTTGTAAKVATLATTETRLVFRNRTTLVSAIVLPLAMGAWFGFTFGRSTEPEFLAVVVALQLSVVLGMTVYISATQTIVARRHNRVLKRLRTSGIPDTGLLVATLAPCVAIGLVQLLLFVPLDAYLGLPMADPLALVLAVVGGLALVVTAALATTVVTATPERAQITTMPLTFLLLGAATALVAVPTDGWWQALILVPGASIGLLSKFAVLGGGWAAGPLGLPAIVPALVVLGAWPVVFGLLARRSFRWDPRN